jgi:hypothetical protein
VVCATALHDIGWLEWERAPVLDQSTGFPLEFQNVPAEIHTKLWRQGIDYAAVYGALPALLVSRHGDAIYERTFDPETARPEAVAAVNAFRSAQHDLQGRMKERLANDPCLADAVTDANLAFTKAFIVAVDTMSLNHCWSVEKEIEIEDVPISKKARESVSMTLRSNGDVAIHPWLFRHPAVWVSVEGKVLDAPSQTQADLDQRFAAAPLVLHHFKLVPRSR